MLLLISALLKVFKLPEPDMCSKGGDGKLEMVGKPGAPTEGTVGCWPDGGKEGVPPDGIKVEVPALDAPSPEDSIPDMPISKDANDSSAAAPGGG